jgi:hypothetical protein
MLLIMRVLRLIFGRGNNRGNNLSGRVYALPVRFILCLPALRLFEQIHFAGTGFFDVFGLVRRSQHLLDRGPADLQS